jgi:hypothetical protein
MSKLFFKSKRVLLSNILIILFYSIITAQVGTFNSISVYPNTTYPMAGINLYGNAAGTNLFAMDNWAGRLRWWSGVEEYASLAINPTTATTTPLVFTPVWYGHGTLASANIMGNGVYPVASFGAVEGGTVNCRDAFRAALDMAGNFASYAGNSIRGGTVIVPPGRYLLQGTLSIPDGVTLQGSWNGPHWGISNSTTVNIGTMLIADVPSTSDTLPALITLGQDACLKGVSLMYPSTRQTVSNPLPFPWTIYCGVGASVANVTLVNSWKGIWAKTSHLLSNIGMCALLKGIQVDSCTDESRIENVQIHNKHWWPYITAAEQTALNTYTVNHLVGYDLYRADWEFVTNSFVIWANVGFRFNKVYDNYYKAYVGPNVMVTQSGADGSQTALYADWAGGLPPQGHYFTNCQFMGKIFISANNNSGGPVKFTNCTFMPILGSLGATTGNLVESQANTILALSSCRFSTYPNGHYIWIERGALLATACDFQSAPGSGYYHFYLNSSTAQATVATSRAPGGIKNYKVSGATFLSNGNLNF